MVQRVDNCVRHIFLLTRPIMTAINLRKHFNLGLHMQLFFHFFFYSFIQYSYFFFSFLVIMYLNREMISVSYLIFVFFREKMIERIKVKAIISYRQGTCVFHLISLFLTSIFSRKLSLTTYQLTLDKDFVSRYDFDYSK